ncbi:hypothetical protein FA13DRAFT_823218 [Coprinellus micaceus]|uniref:Uncharacterized protein n=1 Tax=Coprinellus micaceus TaxID=71717 RepID=A0A4Y7S325_COPMI|nr:hypothetical protein FA13DRAFT_823218 [Coprinellus micaceus]
MRWPMTTWFGLWAPGSGRRRTKRSAITLMPWWQMSIKRDQVEHEPPPRPPSLPFAWPKYPRSDFIKYLMSVRAQESLLHLEDYEWKALTVRRGSAHMHSRTDSDPLASERKYCTKDSGEIACMRLEAIPAPGADLWQISRVR